VDGHIHPRFVLPRRGALEKGLTVLGEAVEFLAPSCLGPANAFLILSEEVDREVPVYRQTRGIVKTVALVAKVFATRAL
jgi:hypothetical protein